MKVIAGATRKDSLSGYLSDAVSGRARCSCRRRGQGGRPASISAFRLERRADVGAFGEAEQVLAVDIGPRRRRRDRIASIRVAAAASACGEEGHAHALIETRHVYSGKRPQASAATDGAFVAMFTHIESEGRPMLQQSLPRCHPWAADPDRRRDSR